MKTVLLIGDTILDEYIYCFADRISPEAPVPVLDFLDNKVQPGGSLNVLQNLFSLSEKNSVWVDFYGYENPDDVDPLLAANSHHITFLGEQSHHLIRKVRLIAQNQQVARVDYNKFYPSNTPSDFLSRLKKRYDLIIFSDYAKGTITEEMVDLIHETYPNTPKIFDMKKFPIGCKMELWNNTIIKCNHKEFKDSVHQVPFSIPQETVVTKGSEGFWLRKQDKFFDASNQNTIVDVTGAGDVFCAGMAVGLLEGDSLETSCRLGNRAAGQKVKRHGTVAVQREWI